MIRILILFMLVILPSLSYGDGWHSATEKKQTQIFSRPYQVDQAFKTIDAKISLMKNDLDAQNLENLHGIVGDMSVALGTISEVTNKDEEASLLVKQLERSWRALHEASDKKDIPAATKEAHKVQKQVDLLKEILSRTPNKENKQ